MWKCHILEELYKNIEHKKSLTKNTVALNINSQQVNIFHINKYERVNSAICTQSFPKTLKKWSVSIAHRWTRNLYINTRLE